MKVSVGRRLGILALLLAVLVQASEVQVSHRSYELAFETVTSTLRRCGVELCYKKIEMACGTLNYYSAYFRKLAFVVFCCVKKQLWTVYEPCEGLDMQLADQEIGEWEKKIRTVEAEEFTKSQVSLMAFCLHFIRSNHENIQLGIMKKLEDAVIKVQTEISSSTSFSSQIEERRSEVDTALKKIKNQTEMTGLKVKRLQKNQGKVRKTLKEVTRLLKDQNINGEIKKYRAIDFFLGSQVYIMFLGFYLIMEFCMKNSVFEAHKRTLYRSLLLASTASIGLDSGKIDLDFGWIGLNQYKMRLVAKAIVFVYFLNTIRTTIGGAGELNRLKILSEFKLDCQKIRETRFRR